MIEINQNLKLNLWKFILLKCLYTRLFVSLNVCKMVYATVRHHRNV